MIVVLKQLNALSSSTLTVVVGGAFNMPEQMNISSYVVHCFCCKRNLLFLIFSPLSDRFCNQSTIGRLSAGSHSSDSLTAFIVDQKFFHGTTVFLFV